MFSKKCVVTAVVLAVMSAVVAQAQFRAGAAKVSITPSADFFPFTAAHEKPFVGVHDDLYVRALALEDGRGERNVIVVVDATAVPNAKVALANVAKEAAVAESHVLLLASHTHNSPLSFLHGSQIPPEYQKELDRVAAAIVSATHQAVQNLQPARLTAAHGESFVNINNGEAAGLGEWNDPHGFSDKALKVVSITTAAGKPLAAMVNYATHGEVMFRSVTKDGGYLITGDLPGAVSRILESDATPIPVVLYTPAAEGDQLPLFKSLQPSGNLPAADAGDGGWVLLDVQAHRLASNVLDLLKAMPAATSDATLASAAGKVTCPGKHRPNQPGVDLNSTPAPMVVPINLLRIGNIMIEAVAGDLASSIGYNLKQKSSAPETMVVTNTAGMVGYLLSDAAYQHPSHGVNGSGLAAGCIENALIDGFASLSSELKGR